jgi:hypothetical protein
VYILVPVVLIQRPTQFIQCRVTGGKNWALLRLDHGFSWRLIWTSKRVTTKTTITRPTEDQTPERNDQLNPMYLIAATELSYPRDKNGRMKANGVVKEANPRVKRSIRPIAYVTELIEPQLSEQQQGVSNGEAIRAQIYKLTSILLLSCSLCNAIGSIAFASSFRLGL